MQRVLLVSSNGAGLGHLTRLLAVTRWLEADWHILTLSKAYTSLSLPSDRVTYVPSFKDLDMPIRKWNRFFQARLAEQVFAMQPDLVVFDGTYIYAPLYRVLDRTSTPLWWLRRGFWKEEVRSSSAQYNKPEAFCDKVVVPGDFAGSEGRIKNPNIEVINLNPFLAEVRGGPLGRKDAIDALGLRHEDRYVLIQLGAGKINDTTKYIQRAVESVEALGEPWVPVLVDNPLSSGFDYPTAVHITSYPLIRHFRAFEFAVIAGGYNSSQEAVFYDLPSIIVPNGLTSTDDQVARGRGLEERGLAVCIQELELVDLAIKKMAGANFRLNIHSKMNEIHSANGAKELANIINALSNDNG